ncbi:MAG: DUF3179 domain-containing protein [Armatimonadota bacterium]|nr:DUF3179 domain-containing protein [Armatimonadota bacterium]
MRQLLVVTVLLAVLALALWPPMFMQAGHEKPVPFSTAEWKTNFAKHSVPLEEIISGGPPKDGIPAIDAPKFDTVAAGDRWLKAREPVVLFQWRSEARAYPLQILIWHEIVNDTVAGQPVAITFCPLCNTAIAFDRRLAGRVLDFGTTGKLRFSDLVMYDRQTESWWQQVTGEAIVGDLTGRQLTFLPAQIVSWDTFRRHMPQGKVLNRDTGHARPYGRNPYTGYDDMNSSPFLYTGPQDARLRPMERVATVSLGGEDVAYPFSVLEKVRVVNDTVGRRPIVVIFERGVASALDRSSIADSRDVGTAAVFERVLDGRTLQFALEGERVVDTQTRSAWTILGVATSGPLRGRRLTPVVSAQHFWFSWAVFRPRTRIYTP